MQYKSRRDVHPVPGVVLQGSGQLAADKMGRMKPEPGDNQRVEAFDADISAISVQNGFRLLTKFPVPGPVLQLHDQCLRTADGTEHLREQGNLLFRTIQAKGAQFIEGEVINPGMDATDPVQRVIMKHHDLAVFGETDIQLDAVAFAGSLPECGERVLRNTSVTAVQTTVGVVDPTEHGTLPATEMSGSYGPDRHTDRGEKELPMASAHHAPLSRLRPVLPVRRRLQAWRP